MYMCVCVCMSNPICIHTKTSRNTFTHPNQTHIPHRSEKTDAFAFGVCLYEMVARALPWKGKQKREGVG